MVRAPQSFQRVLHSDPTLAGWAARRSREEALAERLAVSLDEAGFVVARNEPWSGRDGLIYSAEHHADAHGKAALELEIRQDRAVDPVFRRRLVAAVAAFFAT